jgi:hypothetical protein
LGERWTADEANMASKTRETTPPRKPAKPRGTKPTGSSAPKFTPTKTRKTFPPGPTPKQIDRFRLIEIIHHLAQCPDAIPDASLDALADAAMLPREAVKTYYKRCWERMDGIYKSVQAQSLMPPLPRPNFEDIDPGF